MPDERRKSGGGGGDWRHRQRLAGERGDSPYAFLRYLCEATHNRCKKREAQRRDPAFQRHLFALWDTQGGRCALSRLPMTHTTDHRAPYNVSIDRRDNDKGYVPGNVRLVCHAVNSALGHWGETVFLDIAAAVLDVARACGKDAHELA